MAATFQSVQTAVSAASTSVVVTKPTNLAVGDLMVAHLISWADKAINVASGWTNVASLSASRAGYSMYNRVLYKIADAGDVAAANFTFTAAATPINFFGSVYRITGIAPTLFLDGFNSGAVSETYNENMNIAATITPNYPNDLFLMLGGGVVTTSFSSQAITTSNPSWTEDYDTQLVANVGAFGCHASRPETTATGNVTFSLSASADLQCASVILVAVAGSIATTITAVPGILTLAGGIQVIKTGVKVIASVGSLVLAGGIHIITRALNWLNINKSTASSIININKSSTSTPVNQDKSSAGSITNLDKSL